MRFTGKERDSETGLDYFGARYYSGAQGRFTSPDEFTGGIVDPFTGQQVGQPGPLPYADIADPQTLNKYGYVRNNPLRYTDPDGHCSSFMDCAQGAIAYAKSVAYFKLEGGVGVGAGFRAGPIKLSLDAKKVAEHRFSEEGNTKKIVGEAGLKAEIGPAKGGLAATTETLVASGNQIVTNGKSETKVIVGSEAGAAKQSGWDVGIGVSVGAGLAAGVEVGVNGQKVLKDVRSLVSGPPPPKPPLPPPAPKCAQERGCN